MPRGIRVLTQNSFYHILNRGNQKEKLFLEEADYEKYTEILKHYKRKYRVKLIGYCLMPNHVHMILKPLNPAELARFMQCLTQSYTQYFNKKYGKVGHLWQGRFKSMNIQENDYFLDCVYYVEANPARAGIVSSPADYPWSSYRHRVLENNSELLDLPDTT